MWQVEMMNNNTEEAINVMCFTLYELEELVEILQKNDNFWLVSVEENFFTTLDGFREELGKGK